MASLRCYHHSNCEDHPAVATCSKCGKGLCRECADNLRSEETGKILCVDCLNAELQDDVRWAAGYKQALKKEAITMVVGFILGLILQIVLFSIAVSKGDEYATMLFFVSLFLFFPTLFASFGTIWRTSRNAGIWLLRIPFFLILCVVSPIMFIVRIVKRIKGMKLARQFAALQRRKQKAYADYADYAKQMKTVSSQAEFEREMAVKYTNIAKEEAAKLIAQERAERDRIMQENAELQNKLKERAADGGDASKEMEAIQNKVAKEASKGRDKSRAHSRSTDDVGSGKKSE